MNAAIHYFAIDCNYETQCIPSISIDSHGSSSFAPGVQALATFLATLTFASFHSEGVHLTTLKTLFHEMSGESFAFLHARQVLYMINRYLI